MEEQQKELDGKWLQEGVQRMMVMLESDSRNESFAQSMCGIFYDTYESDSGRD